jgi:hypothetical protein
MIENLLRKHQSFFPFFFIIYTTGTILETVELTLCLVVQMSNSNREYYSSRNNTPSKRPSNEMDVTASYEIVLISRSPELIHNLQTIIHCVIENVEDLPLHPDVKAAVLDTEYARLGSFSCWNDVTLFFY